jgi:hypothetical protein
MTFRASSCTVRLVVPIRLTVPLTRGSRLVQRAAARAGHHPAGSAAVEDVARRPLVQHADIDVDDVVSVPGVNGHRGDGRPAAVPCHHQTDRPENAATR